MYDCSILAHPYLSGKAVVKLAGDKPKNSFSYHKGQELLTARGHRVWWDKKCLEKGKNWEEDFCKGLLDTRAFVCILSKEAINHHDKPGQNLGKLGQTI